MTTQILDVRPTTSPDPGRLPPTSFDQRGKIAVRSWENDAETPFYGADPAGSPDLPFTFDAGICCFSSALGWMALSVQIDGDGHDQIGQLSFGHRSADAARHSIRPPELPAAKSASLDIWVPRLRRFAQGHPADFRDLPLDWTYLSDFGKRVVQACQGVPWGQTTCYGDLARQIGSPGASRAVGGVMARNRHPLLVPCHRVLRANGRLGGFSAPKGTKMKEWLLRQESNHHGCPAV